MLVFDEFPTRKAADDFASVVVRYYHLAVKVFDNENEAAVAAKVPDALTPPVVLVEGSDDDAEIVEDAKGHDGRFVRRT